MAVRHRGRDRCRLEDVSQVLDLIQMFLTLVECTAPWFSPAAWLILLVLDARMWSGKLRSWPGTCSGPSWTTSWTQTCDPRVSHQAGRRSWPGTWRCWSRWSPPTPSPTQTFVSEAQLQSHHRRENLHQWHEQSPEARQRKYNFHCFYPEISSVTASPGVFHLQSWFVSSTTWEKSEILSSLVILICPNQSLLPECPRQSYLLWGHRSWWSNTASCSSWWWWPGCWRWWSCSCFLVLITWRTPDPPWMPGWCNQELPGVRLWSWPRCSESWFVLTRSLLCAESPERRGNMHQTHLKELKNYFIKIINNINQPDLVDQSSLDYAKAVYFVVWDNWCKPGLKIVWINALPSKQCFGCHALAFNIA